MGQTPELGGGQCAWWAPWKLRGQAVLGQVLLDSIMPWQTSWGAFLFRHPPLAQQLLIECPSQTGHVLAFLELTISG